jgi:hypothetical protein
MLTLPSEARTRNVSSTSWMTFASRAAIQNSASFLASAQSMVTMPIRSAMYRK